MDFSEFIRTRLAGLLGFERVMCSARVLAEDRVQDIDRSAQVVDRDLLVRELARLPARQRTVLALRYYTGLDIAEIAVELGCGTSTVRSHLARGLAAMRVELTADGERVR